jgi:hypothetical protein
MQESECYPATPQNYRLRACSFNATEAGNINSIWLQKNNKTTQAPNQAALISGQVLRQQGGVDFKHVEPTGP